MKSLVGVLAVAVAATAVLAAAGGFLLPVRYGAEAVEAVLWACAVALFGSIVGIVPLASGPPAGATPGAGAGPVAGPAGAARFLAAMILRLGAVGLGALAVGLLGTVALEPFLLWLAASYLVLLVVDTAFALRTFRSL